MIPYAGEIASTASSLLWAVALIYFRKSGESVPPASLNLFKNLFALPLLAATLVLMGESLFERVTPFNMTALALSGAMGLALGDTLVFLSLNRVGAGWTAVANATYSPLMILVTSGLYGIPLTPGVGIGALLVAVAIALAGDWRQNEAGKPGLVAGLMPAVVGQLVMAISMAFLKYPTFGEPAVMESESALFVAFWRVLFGTVALIVGVAFTSGKAAFVALKPGPAWRSMAPGSFFGAYLAMMCWIFGMKAITGSLVRAAVLNQSNVIFLPVLGYLLLGEELGRRKIAAIVLAFIGATLVALSH